MKLFSCIRKHPVLFFWLSWLYMGVGSVVCEVYISSDLVYAFWILPANLVTWPLAHHLLAGGRWKNVYYSTERTAILALPVVSTLLTIGPLFLW